MGLANILRHLSKGLILPFSNIARNFWGFLFCSALIFFTILFLVPVSLLPESTLFSWCDKAQHALVFLLLIFLGAFSFPGKISRVALWLFLYGAAIESLQDFTGWRDGDLYDWYADRHGLLQGFMFLAAEI
jgi:VanZ family protein